MKDGINVESKGNVVGRNGYKKERKKWKMGMRTG